LRVLLSSAAPRSRRCPHGHGRRGRHYEAFRAWITKQPSAIQNADDAVVFERYAAELAPKKASDATSTRTIASLKSIGDRAEIERWNRILTAAGAPLQHGAQRVSVSR
jgi:hypothetical protein